MLARLTVHFPFQPTRSFLVRGDAVTVIGRDADCTIVLDDERVSRLHARLFFEAPEWRLIDLGSTNGTTIEGRPIREEQLPDGWISFGGLIARFERSTEEREGEAVRRNEARLRTSISLHRELKPSLGLEPLLDRALDATIKLSGTERGVVLLKRENGTFDIVARRGLTDDELASRSFSGSVGAIQRVVATERTVAVSDALSDAFLRDRASVVDGGIRGLVCVPLVAVGRLIGLVYADSREAGTLFSELDVEILEGLATHAALAIVMARVDRELTGLAARLPDAVIERATSWAGVLAHHQEPS